MSPCKHFDLAPVTDGKLDFILSILQAPNTAINSASLIEGSIPYFDIIHTSGWDLLRASYTIG